MCMYARACVRMCARMCVCEAVCLWLSMVPRTLNLPASYSSFSLPPKPPIQGLQHSIFKVSSTPELTQNAVFFGNK